MANAVEDTRAATGPVAALRLIGYRNFGPYFVGNASSATGTWFQNLAASLYVYRQTHSPFLLGVLQFATFIPVLLLAPWAGSAADRFDRRRLVLWSQLCATAFAGVLAGLAWAGLAPVAVVITVSLGLGVVSAFSAPAAQALIADLVPREEIQSAVALNSMTYNLARAVGPALAALSVRKLGIPASFAINSGSYLVLVAGVLMVHTPVRELARRGEASLRVSLRLLRARPHLIGFLLVVTAVGFASDPINTESPAFAHAFHRPDTDAGYLIGAFGAGAVLAAFALAGRTAGTRRRMATTLGLLGFGVIGFSVAPWLGLGFVFLAIAGFGYLASNTHATSRLQLDVDIAQRGRIMALWSVAFLGLRPLASLTDGAIAGAFGVRAAGVVLALPALAGAGAIHFLQRRNRTLTFQA
ncbi:MAG TPA: MFS transporter [Gaiellaceae bacterium]